MARDNVLTRLLARRGLLLVIIAALTLEATALVQFYFSQKAIREEANLRAESQLESTQNKIMDIINQVESAVRNSAWLAQWSLQYPDSLQSVCRRLVTDNPVVAGSTVALVPNYYPRRPLFSPYVFRNPEGVLTYRSLATEEYDYPSQEWFIKPLQLEKGYWSEPYIDEGGGDMLMTTYSVPIYDYKGRLAAVLTADLSLDWLTELVSNVKVYPDAFSIMLSRSGRIMVSPAESLVMKKTVNEYISGLDDTTGLGNLSDKLLSGESGSIDIKYKGATSYVYFAPVERTGWSMSIIIPGNEIYRSLRRMGMMVLFLQILGLLMLVLMLRSFFIEQLRFNDLDKKRQKMQGELQIATGIQMSMVPKTFPPFPERNDLDMASTIDPAKEVGGDLYDFFIRDEKLFFCVGDVSGKGIPAALVMAVTRTTFRNLSASEDSPGRIVKAMNDNLSSMNESNMFVTFFCGVLDLAKGHLRYCNAGHNPPLILSNAISQLPVVPNLPLGVLGGMEFEEQETDFAFDDALFIYTDGLTEAENSKHELFGEQRMKASLSGRKSAKDHLDNIRRSVAEFVGDAPQSDDLTLLFIHYLPASMTLSLDNEVAQISRLPEFVEKAVKESKLDASLTDTINLALEEAVTNVILYAYPEGSPGKVNIDVAVTDKALYFTISDNGKPFDPTARQEVDIEADVEDRPIGGLGIHLVRNIMDEVRYERRGDKNVLILIKKY